jgi:catechol 2,3-dioxygenase-like lactoylglutathione lyase family enzyme
LPGSITSRFAADYGRFASFYRDVFGADCPSQWSNPSVVPIGQARFHVLEVDRLQSEDGEAHLGHFAIEVDSVEIFAAVRTRLLAAFSTDGIGVDFGEQVSLVFHDPDGFISEVLVPKQGGWDPELPTRLAD